MKYLLTYTHRPFSYEQGATASHEKEVFDSLAELVESLKEIENDKSEAEFPHGYSNVKVFELKKVEVESVIKLHSKNQKEDRRKQWQELNKEFGNDSK